MDVSLETLFKSPDYHLFAFDGDQAIFRAMDREAYHRSIFLDRRISPASGDAFTLPVDLLTSAATRAALPRAGWIFHVAHCGSTLLARALDMPDRSLVLREPFALRQIGLERANAGPGAEGWRARLRLAATLAGRRYRPDAPPVVKANVPVNFVASELLGLDAGAPAIFLYFPLRAYLLAVLRTPGHRQWVVNVTTSLQPILTDMVGPIGGLSAVERAAALWLAQMLLYADAIARFPHARSLHAEDLFNAPAEAIAAAAAHFGIPITPAEVEAIAGGELFRTYSKQPGQKFGNAERVALQARVSNALAPEITHARAWVEASPARQSLPARLDGSLIGAAPLLLDG